mmetsp:Transcript_13890/g.44517  ORF Transcript_13890/g.44517 Transcript_13890/m.44517 type:complete len:215 (+) Transcript_13890:325-969(+)
MVKLNGRAVETAARGRTFLSAAPSDRASSVRHMPWPGMSPPMLPVPMSISPLPMSWPSMPPPWPSPQDLYAPKLRLASHASISEISRARVSSMSEQRPSRKGSIAAGISILPDECVIPMPEPSESVSTLTEPRRMSHILTAPAWCGIMPRTKSTSTSHVNSIAIPWCITMFSWRKARVDAHDMLPQPMLIEEIPLDSPPIGSRATHDISVPTSW